MNYNLVKYEYIKSYIYKRKKKQRSPWDNLVQIVFPLTENKQMK